MYKGWWCLSLAFFWSLVIVAHGFDCKKCREYTEIFVNGIIKSAGKNFEGGNTLWEESHLGSYATSELRFHDIVDEMCEKTTAKRECHEFLETMELHLEEWWSQDFRQNQNQPARLVEDLCTSKIRSCCPMNHYGETCSACLPCSAIGGVCNGSGTRAGHGRCDCHSGYSGTECAECDLNSHFALKEEGDKLRCVPCNVACAGGCTGPSSNDCVKCAPGWTLSGENGCVDIDECSQRPCNLSQYCSNLPGSYKCASCHNACSGCIGPTPDNCLTCAHGFQRGTTDTCEDINECNADSKVCQSEGEECRNTVGGYECDCKSGYVRVNGLCKSKPDVRIESKPTSPSASKSQSKKINKQNIPKIIWTVSFTKEFLKYLLVLTGFAIFCCFAKSHPRFAAFVSLLVGIFVYHQSITFDSVFASQK